VDRELFTDFRRTSTRWVLAEIARVEGRDADCNGVCTSRPFDIGPAITAFVQNEGLSPHELAAGFYIGRGSTTAARAHLEECAQLLCAAGGRLAKWRTTRPGATRGCAEEEENGAPSPPTATIGHGPSSS